MWTPLPGDVGKGGWGSPPVSACSLHPHPLPPPPSPALQAMTPDPPPPLQAVTALLAFLSLPSLPPSAPPGRDRPASPPVLAPPAGRYCPTRAGCAAAACCCYSQQQQRWRRRLEPPALVRGVLRVAPAHGTRPARAAGSAAGSVRCGSGGLGAQSGHRLAHGTH